MLDLAQYESLGAALKAATRSLARGDLPDRSGSRPRAVPADLSAILRTAARAVCGGSRGIRFRAGDRAAIVMTNQSKWLISAYAVFYSGGVLVPLDYKLAPEEHLALLAHSKAACW